MVIGATSLICILGGAALVVYAPRWRHERPVETVGISVFIFGLAALGGALAPLFRI